MKENKDTKMKYYDQLLEAAQKGDLKQIKTLVKRKGVCVNQQGLLGELPILSAVSAKEADVVLSCLIDLGAKINIQNKKGTTPLLKVIEKEDEKALEVLLSKGAILNFRHSFYGITPLIYCVKENKFSFLKKLLEAGADVNFADKNGKTALHHAVLKDDLSLAKYLIEQQMADVNVVDNKGKTPLYLAFQEKNVSLFSYLLNKNAKIHLDTENKKGIEQYIEEELEKDPIVLMYQSVLDQKGRSLKPVQIVQKISTRRNKKGDREKD